MVNAVLQTRSSGCGRSSAIRSQEAVGGISQYGAKVIREAAGSRLNVGGVRDTNRNESSLHISCYLQFHNNVILSQMGMMGCQGTAHDEQCAYQSAQQLKCDHSVG